MKFKNKEYLLLAISFVLYVIVISVIAYVSFREHALHEDVFVDIRNVHEVSEKKGKLIGDFYHNIGYLGMIHNFKNAILRRDAEFLNHAENNILNALSIVEKYKQLSTDKEELDSLLVVEKTIKQYQEKIYVVREMLNTSASSEQIDRRVRIDDLNALVALGSLRHIWEHDFSLLEKQQEQVLDELKELSAFGAHSFPLYSVLVLGFVFFLYRYIGLFHKSKSKISKSEEFIADILASSADAIITIDKDGKIVFFNEAAENLFGYKSDEIIGQDVSILMPEDERQQHQQYVSNSELYVTRVINKVRELEGLRKNGTRFPLDLNVSRMKHHTEPHFIGICRDITARKAIEEDRKAAYIAAVQARTNAEKASQAKSQFLSSMSHELRTPLNSIIGFSQIVKMDGKDNLTDEQIKHISEVERAGFHLLELINGVLDLSKIESGYLDLKIETINLGDLMKQCEMIIHPLLDKYRVKYKQLDNSCDAIVFNTDHLRLKQIVLNLLTNACKYNKPGGTVETRCQCLSDSLRISVIDTGIGIHKSELQDLFEPFNRMGAECGTVEGTGIGLNITLKLVEVLGGNLGVESTPGKGSHFWVDLPLDYYNDAVHKH
ncbi:MAG: PAS domain S-box protein [Gammaproteobacteria bacterium]|nr:PAS domain S-box protein [Gammaproteobacteria bacterium]